ncbi:YtxH domain-containing protein [Cryobacterium fucosi]|uniref:YtxH domain-containing protein n=1 Tax=Cryobacterium fucosi TaxID=1259157 RepID=A0A4R9B8L0_9MICO|nr:YtxH domain-containing protein [Cryobacterium fucosi]TFD78225.1 YtxH domain-containing protein [Cryobacterium fucosi]
MRGKLLFITGGLVGYVLGARAGRKRYDQIAAAAENLWSAPPVQRRVTEVRDFALERVGDVPSALFDAGKKIVTAVQAKTTGSTDAVGTAHSPATPARTAAAKSAAAKPGAKSAGAKSAAKAAPTPASDDTATK